jgi:DNA polymerase III alpha subunit (gram-positive type)
MQAEIANVANIAEVEVILPEVVLVFDVETTGLISKKNESDQIPYITQLSYMKYNTKKNEIIETFDTYVKIPENVVLFFYRHIVQS